MPLTIPYSAGLTSRAGRIAAQAIVVTAVVGGTVAYAQADTTVTLTVDGTTQQVSAFSDTVGELLEDQGITTGDRDLVAPSLSSELDEGDTVVVRYARPLTVTVDGAQRTFWTTETTVDAALAAVGLRADGAKLSASRSQAIGRQGLALALTTPKPVKVVDGTSARTVVTTAATVADLLAELKITLGSQDTLSVPATSAVTAHQHVQLTRIVSRTATVTEEIDFATTRVNSDDLYTGTTKVTTKGRPGSRSVTYALTYTNGKETARTVVATTVTKAPVSQVVQVGTKSRPAASSSGSSGGTSSGGSSSGGSVAGADGLNWAALAQCESGGNPRIVSSNGLYHGLYQFSVSTWRSVGGSGLPSQASSSEQLYRAKILYNKAGAGQWPVCGRRLFS